MFWKIQSKRVEETRKEMTLFVIIEPWWDSYTMDWNKKIVLQKLSQGNQYDCWTASAHVFHLSPIREKYVIRVREARVLKNNQEDQAVTKYSYCTRDVRLLPIKDLNVQTQEHQAERMRAKQEEAKQMIEAMERTRGILRSKQEKRTGVASAPDSPPSLPPGLCSSQEGNSLAGSREKLHRHFHGTSHSLFALCTLVVSSGPDAAYGWFTCERNSMSLVQLLVSFCLLRDLGTECHVCSLIQEEME
jgi:hypothetical protein